MNFLRTEPGNTALARIGNLTAAIVVSLLLGCSTPGGVETNRVDDPKVILIIGDGMDDQQISIARNYLVGGGGKLAMDGMQYRGAVNPQTVLEEDPTKHVYITGSAPAATAMATGILSSGSRISTYPKSGLDAVTIMELAHAAGIATGVVTTASVTDATPASFMSHSAHRRCQAPGTCEDESKSNGGKGSIAEQIADGDMDVVLGGGMRRFEQVVDSETGTTVADLAVANGFILITKRSELKTAPTGGPLLGLFWPGLMPPVLHGNDASPDPSEPFECEDNPDFGDLPRLSDMVETAISRLESNGSYILVVEDEAIDEHAHGRNPCGHVGGVSQIDETVQLVLNYAESHPELLVLVTADHGHAPQIISVGIASGQGSWSSPGSTAQLITVDGSVMGINYATTSGADSRAVHSGVQVPLLASGPDVSEWPVFMPQTELLHIMRKHLGLAGTLSGDDRGH